MTPSPVDRTLLFCNLYQELYRQCAHEAKVQAQHRPPSSTVSLPSEVLQRIFLELVKEREAIIDGLHRPLPGGAGGKVVEASAKGVTVLGEDGQRRTLSHAQQRQLLAATTRK